MKSLDYVFGVAAVGPDGHESLVAAYVNPARADVPVKLVKYRDGGTGAGNL